MGSVSRSSSMLTAFDQLADGSGRIVSFTMCIRSLANVENPDERQNAADNKNCTNQKPIHRSPDQRSRGACAIAQLRAKSGNTRASFIS
jgi:hypothetical protein